MKRRTMLLVHLEGLQSILATRPHLLDPVQEPIEKLIGNELDYKVESVDGDCLGVVFLLRVILASG